MVGEGNGGCGMGEGGGGTPENECGGGGDIIAFLSFSVPSQKEEAEL